MKKKRIYMDFASATPVVPAVAKVMSRAIVEFGGNPSAVHEEGQRAHRAIEEARRQIAESLSVKPAELLFTAGGTEANNLAIRGLIEGMRQRGFTYADLHIITSSIEHSSVLECVALLEKEGVRVTHIKPESDGIVSPKKVVDAVTDATVLVTLAHVNSEVGVIQPFAELATLMEKKRRAQTSRFAKKIQEANFPILHADCAQSPLYLESGPHVLKVDLATYDAQKVGGPKGVGVLYRDFSVPLAPIFGGGSQERGLRPGTENVAGIVGAGYAFALAKKGRSMRVKKITSLRDYLVSSVEKKIPSAQFMGHRKKRIANNAHFAISGADGDYLAVLMNEAGVAVSPRSACVGSGGALSHVIMEMSNDASLAKGTIRFSLGDGLTKKDIDSAVSALAHAITVRR